LKILKKRKVVAHFFDPGENNLTAAEKGLNRPLVRKKESARRAPAFRHARRPRGRRKQKYAKRKGNPLLPIVLFQGIVAQIKGGDGNAAGRPGAGPGRAGTVIGFLKNSNLCKSLTGTAPAFKYTCVDT
jgi:hypothetical protein